ncbi:hypothetical protein L218DRAFT_996803 [Marasmius fiardii PR-910]|nr:hypothetical protein L218DRAFT_996803 [Marasmius fiardii PR-910]
MSEANKTEHIFGSPTDLNLDYVSPSLVEGVKSSWQASFQSAAVVSSLLAAVAAQLLAIISDDSFKEGKNPHAVDALFVVSYGAVLFNASATVTSLVLIDKLGRLLKEPAQRDNIRPLTGYIGVPDHMSLLKHFAVGGSWIWYLRHWYTSLFCGILCLFLQVLLYFVLQNSKGVQIVTGIIWGFTVLPLVFVFFPAI